MSEEKKQLNARVPLRMHQMVKIISIQTGLSLEDLTADSFRCFLGVDDEMAQARRDLARAAWRKINEGDHTPRLYSPRRLAVSA